MSLFAENLGWIYIEGLNSLTIYFQGGFHMKIINLKRLIGILLCLSMVISGTAMVFADDLDEPVTEDPIDEYQYGRDASALLTISNSGTATFRASATGLSGVATKISGTCYLQKYSSGSWTNVKSVEKSTNTLSLNITGTKTSLASGKYRTHAVFKVYSGNNYETIIVNSKSVTYSKSN